MTFLRCVESYSLFNFFFFLKYLKTLHSVPFLNLSHLPTFEPYWNLKYFSYTVTVKEHLKCGKLRRNLIWYSHGSSYKLSMGWSHSLCYSAPCSSDDVSWHSTPELLYDLVFRDLQKQTVNLLFSSEFSFGPIALLETGILQMWGIFGLMREQLCKIKHPPSIFWTEAYRKYGWESWEI